MSASRERCRRREPDRRVVSERRFFDASRSRCGGNIPGSNHFGIWPLSQAAEACFGTLEWPADRVIPQASIEFEVEDVDAVGAAGDELRQAGFELLHPPRTEPWGQTVTRVLTQDGLILGISYAPAFHREDPV
jgi:hypothetical protein